MPIDKLRKALENIDWSANVQHFLSTPSIPSQMASGNLRIAIWSKQLEDADKDNPALSFIREMQVAGHSVVALASLGLYKPAAAAMRTTLETAMYYTFFRTHPAELATLARETGFYVGKQDVVEFHKQHTPGFMDYEKEFGLISKLNKWYGRISAIVHGQVPGAWTWGSALAKLQHSPRLITVVAEEWKQGEELIHFWLLCTAGRELWSAFSSTAKQQLVSGLPGKARTVLELDKA